MDRKDFHIKNFNNDFLLINAENSESLRSLGKTIFLEKLSFIEEVIVTEKEICLKLNDQYNDEDVLSIATLTPEEKQSNKTYHLPIYFTDHEDWNEVIDHTGLEKSEIISRIIESTLQVSMFGFLPGFMYVNGLNPVLHVPRKKVPSQFVEQNSIAIGGKYLGIYAVNSPGGWHVVGKTPLSILQIDQLPPVDLAPGDRIIVEEINEEHYRSLIRKGQSLKEYNKHL